MLVRKNLLTNSQIIVFNSPALTQINWKWLPYKLILKEFRVVLRYIKDKMFQFFQDVSAVYCSLTDHLDLEPVNNDDYSFGS